MDVLGDAISRERRSDSTALSVPSVGRRYDYRRFCTSAWKTGNFLSHFGVRRRIGVAVADDLLPEPVLTFYGAATLGAVVSFDPPTEVDNETRALVVPAASVDAYSFGPETKQIVYGDPTDDPTVPYFERNVWSENPTAPPDRVESDDPLLRSKEGTYTHGEVLRSARRVINRHGIDTDSVIAVDGSFADPTVVVAGLVAPVVAGARIVVGPGAEGEYVVGPDGDLRTIGI